jgi:cyclopropane-fatty-acyl-phospholipid synthase
MATHVRWAPPLGEGRAVPASGFSRARTVATLLFGPPSVREFDIRYWNGVEEPATSRARFTLTLRSAGALRRIATPPSELAFAEAFVRGDIDVEGDLEAAIAAGDRIGARLDSPARIARVVAAASRLPRQDDEPALERRLSQPLRHGSRHSLARDAAAVRSHYDVGNDFYALWLDRSLTYSCAYFERGDEDLDTAQATKLDHICRKLRLVPGDRLLDVGCGWGALIRHAVRCYGVEAVGITLSRQQAAWAQAQQRRDGLDGRCQVVVADYRGLPIARPFNKIVSVGMVEHVGRSRLAEYYGRLYDLLQPGGVLMNHGIVTAPVHRLAAWRKRVLWRRGEFIDRHVFPDGELVPLGESIRSAEAAGFEVRDVETLRDHYALTLRHWIRRLEAARPRAEPLVGTHTYREWKLYMTASAHAFASGRLSVAQVVYGRRDEDGRVALPLTRGDLYAPRRMLASAAQRG